MILLIQAQISTSLKVQLQNLAKFLPYFYEAASQFDSELSSTYGIEINTNLTIKPETASELLTAENPESLTLDFFTVYEDEPNSLGWYLQDRLEADGAVLKNDGTLEHGTCIGGDNRVGVATTALTWLLSRTLQIDLSGHPVINETYKLDDDSGHYP